MKSALRSPLLDVDISGKCTARWSQSTRSSPSLRRCRRERVGEAIEEALTYGTPLSTVRL
ncbi:hypothetical protein C8039_20105 [Halogeometricum sp. wsp3]|nr:hypothetical protein C8039_20105 [Halogeometricum sp. wsp3]